MCKSSSSAFDPYECVEPEGFSETVRAKGQGLWNRFQDALEDGRRKISVSFPSSGMAPNWIQWAFLAFITLSVLMILARLVSLIGNFFQHDFSRVTLEKLEVDDIPLLIRRSQYRTFPLYRVMFRLDVRAYISPESWGLIRKYRLKNLVIYGSQSFDDLNHRAIANLDFTDTLNKSGMPFNPLRIFSIFNALRLSTAARFALNIRVKHLVRGKKVKSKNLFEVAEAERVAIKACKSLHNMLILAETYDGREVIYKMSEVEIKGSGK
ncbi:MAG: hypothetical protein L3J67_13130 [Hyphomicrobiaceae bacterium]|nr:hypothetical protein [Hyphomicrobiaceae bacterium]